VFVLFGVVTHKEVLGWAEIAMVLFLGWRSRALPGTGDEIPAVSVFDPIQLVRKRRRSKVSPDLFYVVNKDVTGFSLSFLGVNRVTGNEQGVQWGLANWDEGYTYGWSAGLLNYTADRFVGFQDGWVNVTEGDVTGVQWGLVNWTEGYVHGWQNGAFNYTVGRFVGLQSGLFNMSKGETSGVNLGFVNYSKGSFKGFQWGVVNYAESMDGFQLGFVNYTKNLKGLQIGLANYNGNKEPLEFMVIANWSF
jgi:hypothetical protein